MGQLSTILADEAFADLSAHHMEDTIGYLLNSDFEFGILCNLDTVKFAPDLPLSLSKKLKQLTLFMLSGYTRESALLDEEQMILQFHAGFGEENFGSLVSVPLSSIVQLAVDDTVIHINLSATIKKIDKKQTPINKSHSHQVFLSNPNNQELIKKTQKQ